MQWFDSKSQRFTDPLNRGRIEYYSTSLLPRGFARNDAYIGVHRGRRLPDRSIEYYGDEAWNPYNHSRARGHAWFGTIFFHSARGFNVKIRRPHSGFSRVFWAVLAIAPLVSLPPPSPRNPVRSYIIIYARLVNTVLYIIYYTRNVRGRCNPLFLPIFFSLYRFNYVAAVYMY